MAGVWKCSDRLPAGFRKAVSGLLKSGEFNKFDYVFCILYLVDELMLIGQPGL